MKRILFSFSLLLSLASHSEAVAGGSRPATLKLAGSSFLVPSLIRGPYLQAATSTSMVVRWRTDEPTDSQVRYGSSSGALNQAKSDNLPVTEHEIKLTGLSPNTRYYYSIGSSTTVYQGDNNNYFETLPPAGTIAKYRFGILGDCGTNSAIQGNVRDQLTSYLGNNYMNAWILLGDNAYSYGTDAEYQSNFFNHYKDNFLKKYPFYPTPGNHDYNNDTKDRQKDHNVSYYDVFTMPKNGEAGGVASGTESFYSFDYGNVHFLSLDSYGLEDGINETRLYDTLGTQVQWIKQDLAANTNKDWIVAYWHHPPYSQGSRNSEADPEMTKVRENFIRILERYGVDLIVCGHSHIYERSRMMQGHYGYMDGFAPNINNLSTSSGKYDGSFDSCPFIKNPPGKKGTVYVVAGSAGQLGGRAANFPHKAMYYSDNDIGGSMLLEVEGNRLDAKWICADGVIRDKFTIEKNVNKEVTIELTKGNSTALTASFLGKYVWSTGASDTDKKTVSVSPTEDIDYTVKDDQNCLQDIFHVKVKAALPVTLVSFKSSVDTSNVVNLTWETSYEQNLAFFAVERSFDGRIFTEIARKDASGNSSKPRTYQLTDKNTSHERDGDSLYYRLKMIENNGQFTYSSIVGAKLYPDRRSLDIEIVPNPSSSNNMQLRLVGKKTAIGKLQLSDISGRILASRQVTLTTDLISFLPERMSPGIYFLRITIDGKKITKKLVIQ